MRKTLLSLPLILAAVPVFAADTLPLKRVLLSSAGLANFEHRGTVDGDSIIELPARLDQVDDILKSLVVLDATGTLGGVTLPGKQPLTQSFRDLPFTEADLQSPLTLLSALRGAEVTLSGSNSITGTLLSVQSEENKLPGDDTIFPRTRLTIASKDGIKQALLEETGSLKFTDPKIQEQVNRALAAILAHRAQDSRTISVNLRGTGKRDVALNYVVAAPLWKTSYRLVLPATDSPNQTALLQGWGILENMTGNDWQDVSLTLLSGNPVTYRQSLYTSYYAERPELPVEVFGRVQPRVDTGTVATAAQTEPQMAMNSYSAKSRSMESAGTASPMAAEMAMDSAIGGAMPAPIPPAMAANAAQSEEATTQVLFQFPEPVSLKAGETLMVPFISRPFPVEQVFLYQPDTNAEHPLAALRLKNDSTSLPPGILTLFSSNKDGSAYVGDAQMPILPKGDTRLISYALDGKTKIDRNEGMTRQTVGLTAAEGVLKVSIVNRQSTRYTVTAPADEDRIVLLEQPRQGDDWHITSPDPKDVETTATHYRVKLAVKAGETASTTLILEQKTFESYEIASLSGETIGQIVAQIGEVPAATRQKLDEIATVQRELALIDANTRQLDTQTSQIQQDQDRIRQNLATVGQQSDLGKRYLNTLNDQENKLVDIDNRRTDLNNKRADAQRRIADLIRKLTL